MKSIFGIVKIILVIAVTSLPVYGASAVSYTITADATTGGKISPSGIRKITVSSKTPIRYTIIPSSGYMIKDVFVNGSSVGTVNTYTIEPSKLSGNVAIHAVFSNLGSEVTALDQTTVAMQQSFPSIQQSIGSLQQSIAALQQSVSTLENAGNNISASTISIDRAGTSLISATNVQEAFAETGFTSSYLVGAWTCIAPIQLYDISHGSIASLCGSIIFNNDGSYVENDGAPSANSHGKWTLANNRLEISNDKISARLDGIPLHKNTMLLGGYRYVRSVFTAEMLSGKTFVLYFGSKTNIYYTVTFNADGTVTGADFIGDTAAWIINSDGTMTISGESDWVKLTLGYIDNAILNVVLMPSN